MTGPLKQHEQRSGKSQDLQRLGWLSADSPQSSASRTLDQKARTCFCLLKESCGKTHLGGLQTCCLDSRVCVCRGRLDFVRFRGNLKSQQRLLQA